MWLAFFVCIIITIMAAVVLDSTMSNQKSHLKEANHGLSIQIVWNVPPLPQWGTSLYYWGGVDLGETVLFNILLWVHPPQLVWDDPWWSPLDTTPTVSSTTLLTPSHLSRRSTPTSPTVREPRAGWADGFSFGSLQGHKRGAASGPQRYRSGEHGWAQRSSSVIGWYCQVICC